MPPRSQVGVGLMPSQDRESGGEAGQASGDEGGAGASAGGMGPGALDLEGAITHLCGPVPLSGDGAEGGTRVLTFCVPRQVATYLYGWTLEGLPRNLRVQQVLLGWVWFMGAQAAVIRQFTEGSFDDPNDADRCAPEGFAPERDSIAATWRLCGPDRWKLVVVGTLYFLPGWFLGAWIFGTLSDTLGRRRSLLISLGMGVVSFAATALAPTFEVYAVARTLVGCAYGGAAIVAFALGCEMVSSDWVSIIGAGYYNACFVVGEMVLVAMAFFIHGPWRLVTGLPVIQGALLLPLVYYNIPESPRWLASQGRVAEARRVLERLSAGSPRADGVLAALEITNEGGAASTSQAAGNDSSYGVLSPADGPKKGSGLLELFRHPKMLLFTLIMAFMWATVGAVYYGLTFIAGDLPGSRYVNAMLLAFVELPGTLLGNIAIDIRTLGRRYSIALLYATSSAACLVAMITDGGLRSVVSFLGKLTTTAAFCGVYVYAAEIFPTPSRNAGLGFSSQIARIGSGVATGLTLLISPNLSMLVFGAMSAASCALCGMLMVETLGRPLPDTIEEAVSAKRKIWRSNPAAAPQTVVRDDQPLMSLPPSA